MLSPEILSMNLILKHFMSVNNDKVHGVYKDDMEEGKGMIRLC